MKANWNIYYLVGSLCPIIVLSPWVFWNLAKPNSVSIHNTIKIAQIIANCQRLSWLKNPWTGWWIPKVQSFSGNCVKFKYLTVTSSLLWKTELSVSWLQPTLAGASLALSRSISKRERVAKTEHHSTIKGRRRRVPSPTQPAMVNRRNEKPYAHTPARQKAVPSQPSGRSSHRHHQFRVYHYFGQLYLHMRLTKCKLMRISCNCISQRNQTNNLNSIPWLCKPGLDFRQGSFFLCEWD